MKIIIDIPKEKVERLIRQMKLDRNFSECKIIELSKPHGRIIDESKITSFYYHTEEAIHNNIKAINTEITHTDAPTIIESEG